MNPAIQIVAVNRRTDQVLGIYTYGQPKVDFIGYDHVLQAAYKDKYFRIVNDTDLVPRLPRRHHHNGNFLQLDADGNFPTDGAGKVIIDADSWKSLPKPNIASRGVEESFALPDENEFTDEEYATLKAEVELAMAEPETESAVLEDDEFATRSIRSIVLTPVYA